MRDQKPKTKREAMKAILTERLEFSPIPKEDIMEWAKSTEVDPRIIKFLKEPMGEGKQHVVTRHRRRTYL